MSGHEHCDRHQCARHPDQRICCKCGMHTSPAAAGDEVSTDGLVHQCPVCPGCSEPVLVELDGPHIALQRTCACGLLGDYMIIPRPGKPGATAMDVVNALAKEYPRDHAGGRCTFCGMEMFEDGETADTHEEGCPWVMANTVAGLEGARR